MKKLIGTIVLVLLTIISQANGKDGINFFEGTWDEVISEAKRTDKAIFVDFYATWCGPCKWMVKEVFTDYDVGEFFNENFINYQVDAEYEEMALVESIDLEAYPTLVFFNSDGDILSKFVGALDSYELLIKGTQLLELPQTKAAFNENQGDYGALIDYLPMVDEEEANDLALIYLNTLSPEDWETLQSWDLIVDYVIDFRSDVVQYILKNENIYSEFGESYTNYMLEVILKSVLAAAIEDQDEDLLNLAINIEENTRELAGLLEYPKNYYSLETQYLYYFYISDYEKYFEYLTELVESYLWDDAEAICGQAIDVAESFYYDDVYMDITIAWTNRAIEIENSWFTNYTAAYCNFLKNNNEVALSYAEESLSHADDDEIITALENFIQEIKDAS